MNEIINKISSYKIFNYLIPGILFVYLLSVSTQFNLVQDEIILGVVLYYFVGMIINRIGALVVEPILKAIRVIVFEPYDKYCEAREKDQMIPELQEECNAYRTYVAVFFTTLVFIGIDKLILKFNISEQILSVVLIAALLLLFIFSYRKQVSYLVKRIKRITK